MNHLIDVHILRMPGERDDWFDACMDSLRDEPVNVRVCQGIDKRIGLARYNAFQLGDAPYVSFVDPDDLVIPGGFRMCSDCLEDDPDLDIVSTSEYIRVDSAPEGKDQLTTWPHHLTVYRRNCVDIDDGEPLKNARFMEQNQWHLALAAKGIKFKQLKEPGYIWRIHQNNSFYKFMSEGVKQYG